jgi:mannitol-1-phosphate/altronate dehydrogenase
MINPYLRDPIDRVTRDPKRKLGWDDRLIGSIRFVMETGIKPNRMISVSQKGLLEFMKDEGMDNPNDALDMLWPASGSGQSERLRHLILTSFG